MPNSDRWQSAETQLSKGNEPESASAGEPDCTSSGDSEGDPDSTSSGRSDGDPDSTSSGRSNGDPDRRKPTIVVRTTRREDLAALERISWQVYPGDYWSFEELLAQHQHFPEGQLVALDADTGDVVGMAASLRIRWAEYSERDSYARMTAGGTFRNHEPRGETLYGAEVMVDPSRRRQGIGAKLYEARRQLARRLGVRRILAGARLPGYRRYADTLDAETYVQKVVAGELSDPTLSFQLSQGFRVVGVVSHYAQGDRQSCGYAALIAWECDRIAPQPVPISPRPRPTPPRQPAVARAASRPAPEAQPAFVSAAKSGRARAG